MTSYNFQYFFLVLFSYPLWRCTRIVYLLLWWHDILLELLFVLVRSRLICLRICDVILLELLRTTPRKRSTWRFRRQWRYGVKDDSFVERIPFLGIPTNNKLLDVKCELLNCYFSFFILDHKGLILMQEFWRKFSARGKFWYVHSLSNYQRHVLRLFVCFFSLKILLWDLLGHRVRKNVEVEYKIIILSKWLILKKIFLSKFH